MRRAGFALEAVDRALSRAGGGRPVPGNAVELLIDGGENYARMFEVIEGARRWIHLENYQIRDDAVGARFAAALARRARAGVRVRLLYDWLGSIGTARRYWRDLRSAGVDVREFHPPRPLEIVTNLARNHRKLLTADGERAVMGGLCIGCAWTGETTPGGQPWRDTGLGIDGPAVALLEQAFAGTWALAGSRRPMPADETPGAVRPAGPAEVRVIAGEPGRERAYRVIELLAVGAIERLWVTDAYLVAPARLVQNLRDAARDGVDVRLLVPSSSDIPFVRNLTRIGYRELLQAGVRIWEWDGPMLHAKTIVADGRWTRVGSSNLNPSSLFGNYELDVLVEDTTLAERMEHQFRRDVARSREVLRRPVRVLPRLSRRLPTVLERHAPEHPQPYRGSPREARARAAVAVRVLIANARRSVFGPVSAILVLLSALFLFLPRTMSYVVGALCVWLAVGASREAFRRRADR